MHGQQSIAHKLYRAGGGHVETTHKLLCCIIRIIMFVQINLRHIKYKMTHLVWLTKCPYVPRASPSATNTVNWRNSLNILFSLRSLSSWGFPRFIMTLPSSAKTLFSYIYSNPCAYGRDIYPYILRVKLAQSWLFPLQNRKKENVVDDMFPWKTSENERIVF